MVKKIVLLLSVSLLMAPAALACLIETPGPHVLDEAEIGVDILAPDPAEDATVSSISRGRGPVCEDGSCASTSCDDIGIISIHFSPAADDRMPAEAIGYRAELLSGALPDGLTLSPDALLGPDGLKLWWIDGASDDQEAFDFTLGIVAIDLAGNESEAALVWVADPGREAGEVTGCSVAGGAGLSAVLLASLSAVSRRRRA